MAQALGASPPQVALLLLREGRFSNMAAVMAAFGAVISEVGAVLMVGGDIRGETLVILGANGAGKSSLLRVAGALEQWSEGSLLWKGRPVLSLDPPSCEVLRGELRRIMREKGITSLYVTRERDEALELADRVAVMARGKISRPAGFTCAANAR
ncbi:MAG: ATP-binding cassette domain-containing protein [Candidatus Eremiobacteraeota bacterium]|nr:ATP-binding cassette domain-containing protein [Candidatus Eremiobacteraeota bacterium]